MGTLTYNPNKYVSVNGDNSNLGILTSPFRDIQHALNMAQDGDIIHVGPGTYYENIEVLKEVTIVSQSGASETVIDARWVRNRC